MSVDNTALNGTGLSDFLDGSSASDSIIGGAGDDTINGLANGDQLFGDYATDNLAEGTDNNQSFADYQSSGAWTVTNLEGGHQSMTQSVATEAGGVYTMSLEIASNFAAGVTSAGVEILVDGVVVATLTSESGGFGAHDLTFTADSAQSVLTIRSIDVEGSGPVIDTSGAIFSYDHEMVINGTPTTVATFAEGQANLYQVLNGTLHVFDTETQTYELAGATGTVNVNSMGFNAQDNLLYAIAVSNGVDSLGNAVSSSDLVMMDADGASYRIGATPYRSWTGDFDDQGNLWSFDSSMDRISVIDVDQFDAQGDPLVSVYKLPKDLVGQRFYDMAFDADTQTFAGMTRPPAEGQNTTLLTIDISSGEPVFASIPVVETVIDGQTLGGVPAMTFGAALYDGDGNLYVGGNSGDHDMNDSTASAGGIYRVIIDPITNTATLELVATAPRSSSNDGAGDPTALSPFAEVDLNGNILIRDIVLVATDEGELSWDDSLSGGGGADTMQGGLGSDTLLGGSSGDTLMGGSGNDSLYGGNGPNPSGDEIISHYDETGARFDQFGNPLGEEDDWLSGGDGDDLISGSAGHDTLNGDIGQDSLEGGSGHDVLFGGDGNDILLGGGHDDQLSGDTGDDTLEGGSGDDVLAGNDGVDLLQGGSGDDQLVGGAGDDTLEGGSDNDVLDGSAGNDVLSGGTGNDLMSGGDGDDSLSGSSHDDTLNGNAGADRLDGGSGNDVISGGDDADYIKGGSGSDAILGGAGKDYINAGSGDDTLDGGDGRDKIYMGAGNDIATGGLGDDRFVFRSEDVDGASDIITDFSALQGDTLDLRQLNFADGDAEEVAWFSANLTQSGSDAVLTLGSTTLTLENWYDSTGNTTETLSDAILF